MTRSVKNNPGGGNTTAKSNKRFKEQEHRAERHRVKDLLKQEKEILPHKKEYGNEWNSPRDGKQWFSKPLSDSFCSITQTYCTLKKELKLWLKWMRK